MLVIRALLVMLLSASTATRAADYPVQPVPFTEVKLTSGTLHDRQQTNVKVTLPFALGQCESSKRMQNFDLASDTLQKRAAGDAHFQHKPVTAYPFDDSDVYKVIEGAAFCLSVRPDAAVSAQVDGFIKRIGAAQEPDGYLYTWRTMHPDAPAHGWIDQQRWLKDPDLSHELYNAGHMYEAGVAYAQATGSKALLDICRKNAELVRRDLGDGDPCIAPGHEVIEMGLAKLYRETGDRRWLDLAKVFLDNRGHGGSEYNQNHKPVVDQATAVGHAVRANYLYAGMADVAALTGDDRYLAAITRIWENVVGRKLHLTGGCGARAGGEAYGDDYELPSRCYNETCAAVAFLFWNHRMFLMTGDAKYMDVFERSLYNGVLSGVSLSGDRFFYPNPLEYDGREVNNHGHAGRAPWFGCACCPPNVLRTLAQLGGYFYAVKDDQLFVNLYAQGTATATVGSRKVKLEQTTKYPWDGRVEVRVTPEETGEFSLCLRIPGWAQGRPLPTDLYQYEGEAGAWTIAVNGEKLKIEVRTGFAAIRRAWKAGDTVTLDLPMPVRRVVGNEKISATRGQVALERGPIVYAFEGIDNDGSVFDIALPASAKFTAEPRADLLGGVSVLTVDGAERAVRDEAGKVSARSAKLIAIPYATWANRGLSPMCVWVARDVKDARPPPRPTLASRAKVSVSFSRGGMDPARVNDQLAPRNATDGFAPNFDFWPHKGTPEWITYTFAQTATVKAATLWWFDDTGTGECRLPASWSLSWQDAGGTWQPVKVRGDYAIRKTEPVRVEFDPVSATALRLELQLPKDFSAGVYEWDVE